MSNETFLVTIIEGTILKIFNFDNNLNTMIQNFQEVINLISSSDIGDIPELFIFFRQNLTLYWQDIHSNSLGLRQIDDLLGCVIIIRVIILALRYNSITALFITIIGLVAGYLWYNTFINTVLLYEQACYQHALTYRLGTDATKLEAMKQAQSFDPEYRIRVTNPIGLLAYTINQASLHEGHRIDNLSMAVSEFISDPTFPYIERLESWYYYWYTNIIPTLLRSSLEIVDMFSTYAIYAFMTRVNKTYCPYLIRWHWTMLLLLKFFDNFVFHLNYRLAYYAYEVIIPKIEEAEKLDLFISNNIFELYLLNGLIVGMIVVHLGFLLFGLLHALCGQYFYIPLLTKNVELHIGARDRYSVYSGGHTAWQDEKRGRGETTSMKPKLWYGFFGRGTKNPNIFAIIIEKTLYNPLRNIIKRILKLIRIKK